MKQIITLLLLLLSWPLSAQNTDKLSFVDGTFKVLQLTDVHYMPQSDRCAETLSTLRQVIAQEQPQLVVLSGDIVTGEPAWEGWKAVTALMAELKTPFVITQGNHDGEYLSRSEMYDFFCKSPYYIGTKGPADIKGCGNCVLPLYGADGQTPQALIYCIDSNDYPADKRYGHYDWIDYSQVSWYRAQSQAFTQAQGKPLPALAFFHIALPEYRDIATDGKTFGNFNEKAVCSSDINSGLFASMLQMDDVMGVFVGHDHDNDFIGINRGIALAYGRVSGADAYGSLTRGGRVILLYEGERRFDTWITTPNGREGTYYYPSGFNSIDEEKAAYLPALRKKAGKQGVAYTYREGKCKRVADIAKAKVVKEGTMSNISIDQAPVKDHFAYEFSTYMQIPKRGIYRFYTFSDDGSQLLIDGRLVVDNDGGHSERRAEGQVALEAGLHHVQVLYFEDYMGETLQVGYAGKDVPETVLPASQLFVP